MVRPWLSSVVILKPKSPGVKITDYITRDFTEYYKFTPVYSQGLSEQIFFQFEILLSRIILFTFSYSLFVL